MLRCIYENYRRGLLLVLLCLLARVGLASHAQGGQLTYTSLGNHRYRISCQLFRDCSGEPLNALLRLDYRASGTGCADPDPRSGTVDLLRVGPVTVGNPYCATTGAPCGNRLLTNYQMANYEAELMLPPNEEWRLFVTVPQRPAVANLLQADNQPLHLEARLRNLVAGEALENTAPRFLAQDVAVPFVCWRQATTLTFSATEPDGDSLLYQLADPLAVCDGLAPWARYPGHIDASAPGCQVVDPGGVYSAAFPIPSFRPGTCSGTALAVPNFRFNALGRSITFRPALFEPGLETEQQAQNKYVVVVQVQEYRRLQGRWELIGSVRRDMLVIVLDCAQNAIPLPPQATAPGFPAVRILNTDSTLIQVPAGQAAEVRVRFADPNPADILTVTHPELAPAVPSAETPVFLPATVGTFTLSGNQTPRPEAVLRLQPTTTALGQSFRIPLRIEDNACPAKGVQNRVLVVQVVPYVAPAVLRIPNVFTPNHDGVNEAFVLEALPAGSRLRIYSRWGRLLHDFANYQNNWDGATEAAGLYYYLLTAPGVPTRKGWVELIK